MRNVADASPHLRGRCNDVEAGDVRGARGGIEQRGEHLDRGAFAGAVRSEQAEDLAVGDTAIEMIDSHEVAEDSRERFGLDSEAVARGHGVVGCCGHSQRDRASDRCAKDVALRSKLWAAKWWRFIGD